mgnify:FL=1
MRLSDYTRQAGSLQESAGGASSFAECKRVLRERLYQDVAGERLARLASLDRERARTELSALVAQVAASAGLDAVGGEQLDRLIDETVDMIIGLGPLESLLLDDSVTEIMVNGPDSVFFEREGRLYTAQERFDSEAQLRLVVDRVVSPLGRRVDDQQPLVNARLPQGHRVNVVIPPVSVQGTLLTIRKFKARSFSLDEMVEMDSMTQPMATLLSWAVKARKNIAVCGGTGGGKTTLLNALSREIPHDERIVTIEDAAELRFDTHPHVVRMETRMANAEGRGAVGIRDLVTNALRMRPDRIIVGECRGEEALDMLQAMTTGHDGSLTTLHAGSPREAMARLVTMVRYGMELPTEVIEGQIVSALDLIVQQDRVFGGGRRITQIASRKRGFFEGGERFPYSTLVRWDKEAGAYVWERAPEWIDELVIDGLATQEEVERWRQQVSLP